MQTKRLLFVMLILIVFVNISVIISFYDKEKKLLKVNEEQKDKIDELENSFNLLSFIEFEQNNLMSQKIFNKLIVFDEFESLRNVSFFSENSFLIFIPEYTCEVCITDLFGHLDKLKNKKIYVMIETHNPKKIILFEHNLKNKDVIVMGYKDNNPKKVFNLEKPICFLYQEKRILNPFIPILGFNKRTKNYISCINKIL